MAFKIFFIYHSHIDIGYTERQEKIANYQADFIRQAVDCILTSKQKDEPFKFTAEGFWAIEQYINKYGEDGEKRLVEAIKTKRFEFAANYLHFAEILNYENLRKSLNYSLDFAKKNGIDSPRIAMASDINGFGWGYSQLLYDFGVENLMTCINTHHGGAPFMKPLVPFWWKTPNGDRILVWNGLAYHKGNLLGLIPGSTPCGDPGIPGMLPDESQFVDVVNCDSYAARRIFDMVEAMKTNGYEYDFLPIMGGGLYTDNNPISDNHCDIVNEFNQKYGDKIVICNATLDEFFDYLRKNVTDIPEYSGDWPDWWTDGCLCSPIQTRVFRNAQRTLKLIDKIDDKYEIISKIDRDKIVNKLCLYAEHTWGHSQTFTDPYKLLVQQLDLRKDKHATDADILSSKALDKLTRTLGEGEFRVGRPMSYTIVNPHDFAVSETIYLSTDFWEEGLFQNKKYHILDENGKEYCAQRLYTLRGAFLAFDITLQPKEQIGVKICLEDGEALKENLDISKFENDFYTVSWDKFKITSVVNKKTGNEMLCSDTIFLGQPVYQVFKNGNRPDAAGFGYSSRKKPQDEIYYGKPLSIKVLSNGEVKTILQIEYEIESTKKCFTEIVLYKNRPEIEVNINMAKDLVMDPEGMYMALPIQARNGNWYLDKPGCMFKAGTNLPKTCCDYFAFDRGFFSSGNNETLVINSKDIPLITIGGLKLWDYTTEIDPKGVVYAWLLNNKWETNFRINCAGFYENRFTITIAENDCDVDRILEKNDLYCLSLRN